MILLIAFPAGSVPGAKEFDLWNTHGLRKSLITPDGSHHFLYEQDGCFLQLRVRGAAVSKPVQLLAEALTAPELLKPRLNALEALNHLWHGRQIPHRLALVASGGDRLRFVLRALDGRLDGASYREIGAVLLGSHRVKNDWNDGSDHLKNAIRRAVQRGRMLTAGGYRRLLAKHPIQP